MDLTTESEGGGEGIGGEGGEIRLTLLGRFLVLDMRDIQETWWTWYPEGEGVALVVAVVVVVAPW